MEYLAAVREHFNEIIAQVQGQIVTENIGTGLLTACFPNYRLSTASGKQFNVMGLLQVSDLSGRVANTALLVFEPSMAMLTSPDTYGFDDMGTLFVVDNSGRIWNKQTEIELLRHFLIFKDKFRDMYHAIPGFPMFLSAEQTRLLTQSI